jgi:hypothetical protein
MTGGIMKKRLINIAAVLALVGLATFAYAVAAGSIVLTATAVTRNVTKYQMAWTSDASGNVSGNATSLIGPGYIIKAEFVPGAGGTQPTNLYDVVFNDANGVDLLNAAGADLSNATSKLIQFNPPLYHDGATALDLVVSNAGNAKTGTLYLWVNGQ